MRVINKMRVLLVFSIILYANLSLGAMKVNQSSTTLGSIVTVTMQEKSSGAPDTINFTVDFGDGSGRVTSPIYSSAGTHTFKTTHIYNKAGRFTVTGTTIYNPIGLPPKVERRTVTIGVGKLPRGRVGEKYHYSLATLFGSTANRYQRIGSMLPPGLTLQSNGIISGVPTKVGQYPFTVQVNSRSGISNQQLTIFIDPSNLIIRVSPKMVDSGRAGAGKKVTFSVLLPAKPINETIRSTRGEFIGSGRVLGYVNSPMLINLNTVNPSGSERLTVPTSVLQSAKRAGVSTITYRRVFSSHLLGSGTGEMSINIRTSAAGQFRIGKMRIFFEQNNRSTIVVDRNTKKLTGVLEMHYNGSGALRGYWKVDERIIQRVQQNVIYGKVLSLKTPSNIPLPTFSEGSHRLQFIVTDPEGTGQEIDFPLAIYHVQAKNLRPITLISPINGKKSALSGETFNWTKISLAAAYRVEFLETGQEEPFFTAHVKKNSYSLPSGIIELKFSPHREYIWRIRGLTEKGTVNSESSERRITLLP